MNAATQLKIVQGVEGVPITITRGATVVSTKAVRGFTRDEMTGNDGTQTEFFTTDWLVTIDQTGALGKPQRNDLITCSGQTFTVAHPDPNSKAVTFHGNDGTAWRIHSVQNGA